MPSLYRSWGDLPAFLIRALIPPRCLICNMLCKPSRTAQFCPHCVNWLSELKGSKRCIQCGLRLGERLTAFGWIRCRHCRSAPDELTRTWVYGDYGAPLDSMIKRLKYGGFHELALPLAHLLAQSILAPQQEWATDLPDVLIPVPVTPNKLRQRGYNQAELIAQALGKVIRRPTQSQLLMRVRHSKAQASANRENRAKQLQEAFRCASAVNASLHIGLVDDVITTQATLNACMSALKKAGAKRITCIAICRTPE